MLGKPVDVDPDSSAQVYLLGADERPADNIYGEQPYGDATGRRIAIRYYPRDGKPGGIEFFDLHDASRHVVLTGNPPFPAFHPWAEWLYYAELVDGNKMLRRCNYLTLQIEDVAELPRERGAYSYGTVSGEHRYYAVSVTERPGTPAKVHLLDLQTGGWTVLLYKPGFHAKHEQFSRDGRNRVLIQLNRMPDVDVVLLSELEVSGEEKRFPADRPYTPRPTGHEAWIGTGNRIFYSTDSDSDSEGNVWTGAAGDERPTLVCKSKSFGHVSVSRDGKYWIGDTNEEGIPLYIGSFETGRYRQACLSRTEYDGRQWSHAHPYLTADNRWLIFGARRGGHPQTYGAKLAEGWLAQLD